MECRRWEDLTFDCLVFIFSKLGLEDLLTLGVSLVCKSFHAASMDPQCWEILDFQDFDFSPNSKFIAKFKHENHVNNFSFHSLVKLCSARSHGSATKLSVPQINDSPIISCLTLASIQCPKLKVLTLPILLGKEEKQIPGLLGKWKELETFELKWKPVSFLDMVEEISANCPKFTELRFRGVLESKDAKAIVKNFPGLKRLAITSSLLRVEDVNAIFDGCSELRATKFSRCTGLTDASDEDWKRLSMKMNTLVYHACKRIEQLNVGLIGGDSGGRWRRRREERKLQPDLCRVSPN